MTGRTDLHGFSSHVPRCQDLRFRDPGDAFRALGEALYRPALARDGPCRLSHDRTGRTCSPIRCRRSGPGAGVCSALHTSAPSGVDVSVYAVCHWQIPCGDHAPEKCAKAVFSADLANSELRPRKSTALEGGGTGVQPAWAGKPRPATARFDRRVGRPGPAVLSTPSSLVASILFRPGRPQLLMLVVDLAAGRGCHPPGPA